MNIQKSLLLISVVLGLSACASNTQSIKYYSLGLNGIQDSNDAIQANQVRVVVAPIQLAKFLNQNNMVMQIGEHEIYKANFHRWAEPLDQSISKLLVQKLNNKKSNAYQFVKSNEYMTENSSLHLSLEIDQFHSTDNAQVILSGHYWLHNKEKSFASMKHFSISEQLTRDGYHHSVEKLKGLLGQLANQIVDSIRQHRV
ncbi:MAG: hypothetical protein GQ532_07565 [Methylomarinum sp.]|nr:hypothetical protein [Methylomarinum sp.]